MKLWAKEQQQSYENVKICYICEEKFENKYLENEKHRKVTNHVVDNNFLSCLPMYHTTGLSLSLQSNWEKTSITCGCDQELFHTSLMTNKFQCIWLL